MTDLSMDRREFARLCIVEMRLASKLCGGKAPDADWLAAMAEDMARSPALSRVPCARLKELFAHARAHHSETPVLRHLVKSWNTISPKSEPLPTDAPRLPAPPELSHSEAQMRKLAAIRTMQAEQNRMGIDVQTSGHLRSVDPCQAHNLADQMEPEEWMVPLLQQDPSREEVEAMRKASTDSTLAFYRRMPDLPPCWGGWIAYYGF